MRTAPLLAALLLASLPLVALAPAAAAIGNCPNGWNGVLVTQPSGNPYGVCCSPTLPMTCRMYRLDEPPVLP